MKSNPRQPTNVTASDPAPDNPFGIDREIFKKEDDRHGDLHLQLSEKYMIYKDLADRCLINPANTSKEDLRVFYMKPDSIFLQEPRLQNQYRNEYLKKISTPPAPEPFTLQADEIHRGLLEDISDQSNPSVVKEMITKFYRRRQFRLQHKRHKILNRWSHFAMTSELVDKVSLKFTPNYSKIQFELENAVKRFQRLEGEDHFSSKEPRPKRLEPNGTIKPEDKNIDKRMQKICSLRVDDIDVYWRIVGYDTRCSRGIDQFTQRCKWAASAHRFEIFTQTQEHFQVCKQKYRDEQRTYAQRLEAKAQHLIQLRKLGDKGTKEMHTILASLPQTKQEKKVRNIRDTYLSTSRTNYDLPPLIICNQVDLKLSLEDLCKIYNLSGDMEVDDGNSFSYTVMVHFPSVFSLQVIKTQFAQYDALPTMQNPKQLGQNIQQVLEENQRKYGKNLAGNTLMEVMDIQKAAKEMNVHFINQIEKAIFGEFNNGQKEFPKVRLKKSHWIPYICFKAEVPKEQHAQAALFSSERNPTDELSSHLITMLNINDVTSSNLTLESLSQIHADKLKHGRVIQDFLQFDHSDTDNYFTQAQKQLLQAFIGSLKSKKDFGASNSKMANETDELGKNSLYETSQHLLFANYLLTCLKARDHKTSLLYILNVFRSIQKRIAIELRELGSRDRISFDCNIVRPKEKLQGGGGALSMEEMDQETSNENQTQSTNAAKKSSILGGKVGRDQDEVMDEMIDINEYRLNGQAQNQIFSTCPVLPKFHLTYGEPIERQEVSYEFEVTKDTDPRKALAHKILGRIDRISLHEPSGLYLVTDDFGVNVMYDASFVDMQGLEQELLRTMSFYVNKVEPMVDSEEDGGEGSIMPAVDRFTMLKDLLLLEDEYQMAKLEVILCYLECYEHTCDTLEQQRIIQIMIDLMAKRPRLNTYANSFHECYKVETQVLQTTTKMLREFIRMQYRLETEANRDVREYLELSYRLINEQIANNWQYFEPGAVDKEMQLREFTKLGVQTDEDAKKFHELKKSAPGMFSAKQPNIDPKTFADMLGIPFSHLQQLMREHHERDPLVKQSIHEHVSFIKLQEGYPIFFTETNEALYNDVELVPNGQKVNILDFYESLSQVSKITAVIDQTCAELRDAHRPDNGFISATMELKAMEFLFAEMIGVSEEQKGFRVGSNREMDLIQDNSIVGNAEKMLFFTKELVASSENPAIVQSPCVLTKINLETINDYDFDEHQGKTFRKKYAHRSRGKAMKSKSSVQNPLEEEKHDSKGIPAALMDSESSEEPDDLNIEQIYDKVHRKTGEGGNESLFGDKEAHEFRKRQADVAMMAKKNASSIKTNHTLRKSLPSMLQLCCNSVELMRLRQVLVNAYHQRTVLSEVYATQSRFVGKDGRVFLNDAFNFETFITGGDNWVNYVDNFISRYGAEDPDFQIELAINEFDPTLRSYINFQDPDAYKSLICPMGLAEMRVVVYYELVNLQLLMTAVRHNQMLMDTPMRQLAEIDLFERGYLVTAPSWDMIGKLQGQNLYEANLKKLPSAERQKIKTRIVDNVTRVSYGVVSRKLTKKEVVEKQFKVTRQVVSQQMGSDKVEVVLRYLRTARMALTLDYCRDLTATICQDQVKVELLGETRQIRRRAFLLPKEAMVHKLFQPEYGEVHWSAYSEEIPQADVSGGHEKLNGFWDQERKQMTASFWAVPSNLECIRLDHLYDAFKARNCSDLYRLELGDAADDEEKEDKEKEPVRAEFIVNDQLAWLQSRIPTLKPCNTSTGACGGAEAQALQQEAKLQEQLASHSFAYDQLLSWKYLNYFRQMSQLFDLEIFFNKLPSRAHTVAGMEQAVLAGISFWDETDDTYLDDPYLENNSNSPLYSEASVEPSNPKRNQLAERVAQRVALEKKHKQQLVNDLESIKDQFSGWERRMRAQDLHLTLSGATAFLNELVHIHFYNLLHTLGQLRENYCKEGQAQKEIHVINDLFRAFSRQNDARITYNNGFHVSYAIVAPSQMSLDECATKPPYESFFKATSCLMEEQGLQPTEFAMLKGLFTPNRRKQAFAGVLRQRDFAYLDERLFVLSNDIRKYIAANLNQNDTLAKNYAHQRMRIDESYYASNGIGQIQMFSEVKQFLRVMVRTYQLKRCLMMLMIKGPLPTDVTKLRKLYREFQETISWKVMMKIDELERRQRKAAEAAAARQEQAVVAPTTGPQGLKNVRAIQKQVSVVLPKREQADMIQQYEQFACEMDVYYREIQNYMITTSKRMIERESTALSRVFELNGKKLACLIDNNQQFAYTFEWEQDRRNHLDITNFVSAVQKMLTAFSNRCLEIKTLTSGEGVVISRKDLDETMRDLCRSIIKNSELAMRTRVEQLSLTILSYENLLYAKDQQILSLEHKLQSAADEMNRIVNTKVFTRGNTIIYELDHANRQLRLMRDNVHTLEKVLKKKIKLRFGKDLEQTKLELKEQKRKFYEFQTALKTNLIGEVKSNINQIDEVIKRRVQGYGDTEEDLQEGADVEKQRKIQKEDSLNMYSHLLRGDARHNFLSGRANKALSSGKNGEYGGVEQLGREHAGIFKEADLAEVFDDFKRLKTNEEEAREEVLRLQELLRKQRLMQNLKWSLFKQKQEYKVDNLKQQLTSNSTLWEQLAESEKRERLLKQELEKCQEEISNHEKVTERLKDEIKRETREKQKLIEQRGNKASRLEELEGKAKEFEVLGNVDLTRLLTLIERKEKRIKFLERQNLGNDLDVDQFLRKAKSQVRDAERKQNLETSLKNEAMGQLDMIRKKGTLLLAEDEQIQGAYWKGKFDASSQSLLSLREDYDDLVQCVKELKRGVQSLPKTGIVSADELFQKGMSTLKQESTQQMEVMLSPAAISLINSFTERSDHRSKRQMNSGKLMGGSDASTHISDKNLKKREFLNIGAQTKIPKIFSSQNSPTSQQQSQQIIGRNRRNDSFVHLPLLKTNEKSSQPDAKIFERRNRSMVAPGPHMVLNIPQHFMTRKGMQVLQPQSIAKKVSSSVMFEDQYQVCPSTELIRSPESEIRAGSLALQMSENLDKSQQPIYTHDATGGSSQGKSGGAELTTQLRINKESGRVVSKRTRNNMFSSLIIQESQKPKVGEDDDLGNTIVDLANRTTQIIQAQEYSFKGNQNGDNSQSKCDTAGIHDQNLTHSTL